MAETMNRAERRRRDRAGQPAPQPLPLVPAWGTFPDGTVQVRRDAEFWHRLDGPGRRVRCTLCYRDCRLSDGEAGWCGIRQNEGGTLTIPYHGQITTAAPVPSALFWWRWGGRSAWFGSLRCTAHCEFCITSPVAWRGETLPWAHGEGQVGWTGGWTRKRAMLHPAGAITVAREWGCPAVRFGISEPMLTYEWTLDTAMLAHSAGLLVHLDTNGFSTPAAIRRLAPFVDMVHVGAKGHLSEPFYAKWMRAEGAVPHVLKSIETWAAAGVRVAISDIVPPTRWVDRAAALGQAEQFYRWLVRELGALVPLGIQPMFHPTRKPAPLLPAGAGASAEVEYFGRLFETVAVARDCGLSYVYADAEGLPVRCHHCGGVLLAQPYTPEFEVHLTDGRCDHCGTATPLVAIDADELAAGVTWDNG